MSYDKVIVPRDGEKVTVNADLSLNVPSLKAMELG